MSCVPHRRRASVVAALSAAATLAASSSSARAQTRAMGVDVSEFQGSISWSTVKNTGGRSFAFIRATRGGTSGTSPNGGTSGTGLARYDDPTFFTNISNSKNAGVLGGAYHFARADIIPPNWPDTSTGVDEATHFLSVAGPYMKPGYLLPVLDLEAGANRSTSSLSAWARDFADTIRAATGVYPIIYANSSYAVDEVDSTVAAKMPSLWLARPSGEPTTGEPIPASSHLTPATGKWPTWMFWQYKVAPSGTVPGINAAIDLDVAHGTIEYVKDFLVPAFWTASASGNWATTSNWNSHNAGYNGTTASGPPSRAPGNISGTANLSGIEDTVILDNTMTAAAYTVTLDSGNFNIRKLYAKRPLNITGGSLTINYDPTTTAAIGNATAMGSTSFSAQFSDAVSLSGAGSLSVHTLLVDAGDTFTLAGGSLTLSKLTLTAGSPAAKLLVAGDVSLSPLNNAAAVITSTSTTTPGTIDLGGGARTLTVANGNADVDLSFDTTLANGTLTKAGPGTLQLSRAASLTGTTTISAGTLIATLNNQLGTGASVAAGASLYLTNLVAYNRPLTLAGSGASGPAGLVAPGTPGNLHASSGAPSWTGPISLTGTGSDPTDPALNTVSAAAGTALTLSGVISPAVAGTVVGLAKSDAGTVILTGGAPNTYTGPTHVYGGTLVLEKDGALGTRVQNTYQLAGSASTIAFRAPSTSPDGFTYATGEYLFTEGTGNGGLAQIENLGGDNTFAGTIAVGGPSNTGSIGVSAGSLTITGELYGRGTTSSSASIKPVPAPSSSTPAHTSPPTALAPGPASSTSIRPAHSISTRVRSNSAPSITSTSPHSPPTTSPPARCCSTTTAPSGPSPSTSPTAHASHRTRRASLTPRSTSRTADSPNSVPRPSTRPKSPPSHSPAPRDSTSRTTRFSSTTPARPPPTPSANTSAPATPTTPGPAPASTPRPASSAANSSAPSPTSKPPTSSASPARKPRSWAASPSTPRRSSSFPPSTATPTPTDSSPPTTTPSSTAAWRSVSPAGPTATSITTTPSTPTTTS